MATARDPAAAPSLAALAASAGGRLIPLRLDVADPASIEALAQELKKHVDHIDVCINNAGVALERFEQRLADLNTQVSRRAAGGALQWR